MPASTIGTEFLSILNISKWVIYKKKKNLVSQKHLRVSPKPGNKYVV